MFGPRGTPYAAWGAAVGGDVIADPLLSPMDWWLTPLSPARHAAGDGSDMGALPFAGIGAPPAGLKAERGAPPAPRLRRRGSRRGRPRRMRGSTTSSRRRPAAARRGSAYTYAGATDQGDGRSLVLDWLAPDEAYWVTVSTGYYERGESEAAEPVYVGADRGQHGGGDGEGGVGLGELGHRGLRFVKGCGAELELGGPRGTYGTSPSRRRRPVALPSALHRPRA
ncbi:MAG: hypothetical protein U0470_07415 [Anaerolineae bacterium]